MTKRSWVSVWALALGAGLFGCAEEVGQGAHAVSSCDPGTTAVCACVGGVTATQVCEASGVYSPCACPGGVAGQGGAAGSGFGNAGFGAAGFGSGAAGTFGAAGSGLAGSDGAAGSGFAGSGFAGSDGAAGSGFAGSEGAAGTGAAGTGGAAGSGGAAGTGSVSGAEPKIPAVTATCPTLQTGTVKVLGQNVQLWVGAKQPGKRGSVFFYWHGTGGNSGEANGGLGSALAEITAGGGMVASFTTTTGKGTNTGNNVWYTGDFEMADILLKCAVEQLDVDTRRVYTGGCSAGGLQAGAMVYGRSSYLAGAMPNSGGVIFKTAFQDPAHVPSLITTHGGAGVDVVVVDFSNTSATLYNDVAAKGGMAVNCNHGGNHCFSPSPVKAAQWEFLKAHPFGVTPDPYAAGLPASFPSTCKIIH